MRAVVRPLVVCLFVLGALGLASPAWALDDIITNDGEVHRGKILEVQDNGIRVTFRPKSGGTATMTVPARKLDPHFFYGLRDKAAGDDAKAHAKLALWCVEAGLFSRAKAQVQRVQELDPQLIKDLQAGGRLADIREGIAQKILDSAKRDMDEGRLDNAETKLHALLARMPDTPAGDEAQEVLPTLDQKVTEHEAQQKADAAAKREEADRVLAAERDKLLDPVDKDLKQGREYLSKGLVEEKESRSLDLLKKAIGKGANALKKLDKLQEKHGDDQTLMDEVATRREKTIAGMVKAHLNRADLYTGRRDFKRANAEIAAARKLDPDSNAVSSAEQRVQGAESDDGTDVWWYRARREGVDPGPRGRFSRPGGRAGGAGRAGGGGGRRR